MRQFDISVVIPVYNTQDYLQETLDSIVRQSIGMQRIQVVLVDDGSTDGSAGICERFARAYPENVVFIRQANAGVSAARNRGIEAACGKVLTFLDSDDLWTDDAFEVAVRFFEDGDGPDVLCADMRLFDREKGKHPLSYKYAEDGVIDLDEHPCDIHSTIGNCFFRTSAVGQARFDARFSTSEDTLFVNALLLGKRAYGVTSRCAYLYRKRVDGSSLSQRRSTAKHLQNLDVCRELIAESKAATGEVLPYVQAVILYIVNWQLFAAPDKPLDDAEAALWNGGIDEMVGIIDDEVLCGARWVSRQNRIALMRRKHGEAVFSQMTWLDGEKACWDGLEVCSLNAGAPCQCYEVSQRGGILHIEATTDLDVFGLPFEMRIEDDRGGVFPATMAPFPTKDAKTLAGQVVCRGYRAMWDLPLEPGRSYRFTAFVSEGSGPLTLTPHFGEFGKFDQTKRRSYCVFDGAMVFHRDKVLHVRRRSFAAHLGAEALRLGEILRDGRFKLPTRIKYVAVRVAYHLRRAMQERPVWIFADKEWKAGDNAENVYRYAVGKSGFDGAEMLFALEKTSSDYPAVASYGRVIEPSSGEYKMAFLLSSKIISSRCELSLINPFGKRVALVKDFLDFDLVYLTHGTLFGDLSSMLNRPSKMIKLFCASTQMERRALLGVEYAYAEDQVKVLGMARYDAYGGAETRKLVAFLPTWRAEIAGPIIAGTSMREYVPDFKTTDFYRFYNELINDGRLLAAMERNGYVGEFYVHPAFEKQASDFEGNELVSVGRGSADYERVLSTAALLVTDYSGVGFDFGYQRKPIVYSHFDSVFGSQHTYGEESYFSYERDGFGPVAYDLDGTVDAIVAYLDGDCAMEPAYRQRADAMFGFSDYESCRRIFEAVVALDAHDVEDD